MKVLRLAGVWIFCLLTACRVSVAEAQTPPGDSAAADAAPLFRVFLTDGSTLVSFGELARLDDRVVFSMPTSASTAAPQLQLISIPSDRVDWPRTLNYAESVRATRYLATRAESDYALLTTEIAQALNDIGLTDDPARRLAVVERARKTLAEWPASHYNYRRDEIQQMLGMLDEAIASLRAATGSSTFDLTLVAAADPARPSEPLLPQPDQRETIEQTLRAARLTPSPAERLSLLTVAANALEADAASLPAEWADATRVEVAAQIAAEIETDRKYRTLSEQMLRLAAARAGAADVRGVERVMTRIKVEDKALGQSRPETVTSMIAAVEIQLDAARRLRLERDRWALRAPDLRSYRAAMATPLLQLRRLTPLLENIKSLAGSGPDAIVTILRTTAQIEKVIATIDPPSELRDAHNLFVSALHLASSAAKIRREAAIAASMARAWDASSAAAGALMLSERARTDMRQALRPPQLPQ